MSFADSPPFFWPIPRRDEVQELPPPDNICNGRLVPPPPQKVHTHAENNGHYDPQAQDFSDPESLWGFGPLADHMDRDY